MLKLIAVSKNIPVRDGELALGTWQANMGGDPLTPEQETSLQDYVAQLRAPAGLAVEPSQLEAGAAAFLTAGCGGCHNPSRDFTNDGTADVGRGMHKVPSLIGLLNAAPYMSDGCAATLEQRFADPACGGGDKHGNVSALSEPERAALVSYLQSL